VKSPFSFEGGLGRLAYALTSTGVFLAQYLVVVVAFAVFGQPSNPAWWVWLDPLRALVFTNHPLPAWVLLAAMALTLAVDTALAILAFRRARNTVGGEGIAALVIVPVVQVLVIAWLSLAPNRSEPAPAQAVKGVWSWSAATQGVLAGVTISVLAVALSTLVLHLYGYGLFIVSPFVIGLVTGYLTNREADLGGWPTFRVVGVALVLGAFALIGFAFEGIICLVFASPLIAIMGWVGGEVGRAFARNGRRGRRSTLMSVSILPLILFGEAFAPPTAGFDSVESVEIAAPPAAVWDAVIHMGPIPDAPAVPFRWGLAYPMRGEIYGAGVGAIRRGVFSTGVAYERVTEWEPNRKLSFIVLSDPPTMRELSPYQHVNAPHVVGYFRTLDARFTITPLADGHTRLALATRHELDLEPALYWLPFAEWATHANKIRVLAHFREQAEASHGRPVR
jgi:hypothetical protein